MSENSNYGIHNEGKNEYMYLNTNIYFSHRWHQYASYFYALDFKSNALLLHFKLNVLL